jgi:hypothetical protein
MRTPALDLDSIYGRGPALDPFLYRFPGASEPPTAVRMQLGQNRSTGTGGPLDASNNPATPVSFDVPRVLNGTNTTVTEPESTFTAIIGDPRNDENLIVSQLHHAILEFHNRVVELLVTAAFSGDIFAEAKKIVTQHFRVRPRSSAPGVLELGCRLQHVLQHRPSGRSELQQCAHHR